VQGDPVFAVEAQPQIADAHPEAHQQNRFEGVRGAPAARQQVHGGRDQRHDRHVASGLQAVHGASVGQSIKRLQAL